MALPLEGIRVLDLTRLLPGPYGTLILADLGAEVIKIEDPHQGDYVRWSPPYVKNQSIFFLALNRNKKSVAIDLKSEKGKEVFLKLVEKSDVVVESFRPGVMEKMGLGYEILSKRNPKIIMCSISGYGRTGPYSDRAGHDINYLAISGFLDTTGVRDGPPVIPGGQIADISGSLYSVIGILTALVERARTGKGRYIEIAMAEGAMSFLIMFICKFLKDGILPTRGKTHLSGEIVCYNIYETKDGRYLSLGALEPKFWQNFVKAIGREDLIEEGFSLAKDGEWGYEEVKKEIKKKTLTEWIEFLKNVDACAEPVNTVEEAINHPQFQERGMIFYVEHPEEGRIPQMRTPISLPDVEVYRSHPPKWGEHTVEVLKNVANLSDEEIKSLIEEGVVKRNDENK